MTTSLNYMTNFFLKLDRRISGLKTIKNKITKFQIPYLEGGQGETLVLVHGFGGDKDNFTKTAKYLTKHFHVIIPDLPGFGETIRDLSENYNIDSQVENLKNFLRALNISKFHIAGNSMGGFIATTYAAKYPDDVQSLWLIDSAGTFLAHETPIMRHYEATGELPMLIKRPKDIDALVFATMSRPPYFPKFMRKSFGIRAMKDLKIHTQIIESIRHESPLLEDQFSNISTPTLIVWGSEDKILSTNGISALQKILINSKVIVFDGIGHIPMLECPKKCAKVYIDFIKNLSYEI